MAGRTASKFVRFYMNGCDLSGDTRSVGTLEWNQDAYEMEALTWEVKGALPVRSSIRLGTVSALLNSDGSAQIHDLFKAAGNNYNVMIPIGDRAVPAQGDPVFCSQLNYLEYMFEAGLDSLTISLIFGSKPANINLQHTKPWGRLLHAKSNVTAENTAAGIDDGGATANGGIMAYQIFGGDGTATIKIQEAATNTDVSFSDLTGATTGVIDCETPSAGLIQLATNAAVKQYLRWQIALGTATQVNFALAFIRSAAHNV